MKILLKLLFNKETTEDRLKKLSFADLEAMAKTLSFLHKSFGTEIHKTSYDAVSGEIANRLNKIFDCKLL